MLIKCPECELQVSDKAVGCPHCGYPLKTDVGPRKSTRKSNKRRRLPNGFGQISEIKGRSLRKPFRAMISVGKHQNGRPICKPLKPNSYFETYNDAYAALVEYNKNPYDLSPSITLKELYEKWSEEYFKTLKNDSGVRVISSAWSYCSSIHHMRVVDIRARHIKGCMENGIAKIRGEDRRASNSTKSKIKSMFNLMLDYAIEYEIVERNYARTFSLSDEIVRDLRYVKKEHIPFTDEEMKLLWENINTTPYVDVLLIQCYSGWRPQELGLITIDDVDLNNWLFRGGIKTDAGTNRVVPIHPRIRDIVKRRYEEAVELHSAYLLNYTVKTKRSKSLLLSYDRYSKEFKEIRDTLELNPEHRPHDGRKHFVTMCKNAGVDEYAIKYMVGHTITDITERIYTQREFEWLKQQIEKIK